MEKIELFKLLLKKDNYINYRHKLDKEIFPEALQDLYESLEAAHAKTQLDISCRDVWYIHTIRNPTLTEANKNVIKDILGNIAKADEVDANIVEEVVNRALIELKATRIARAALEIAQGKSDDFVHLESLISQDVTKEDIALVTTDIAELSKDIQATYKWRFNLPRLDEAVGPIGPEVFAIFAGPVNSGKSLMGISFTFGPGGFAEQGAKCLYIGNEESLKRTMMRGISAYTGMTKDEIWNAPQEAQQRFNKIRENVYLIDDVTMNFNKLAYIMQKLQPDIVILDMLDKVRITGSFQRGDEKLAKIYEMAREYAKKYKCAVIGLSQTNGDTFGQLIIDQNQLAGSRVDKAANCDLMLTLGQLPSNEENNNFRRIHVAKSKLEGNAAKIDCAIQPHLSRLVP